MRYELLLQPAGPDAPFEKGSVDLSLRAAGASEGPDGTWEWALPQGTAFVSPVLEQGGMRAMAIGVPLSDRLDLMRATLVAASALAAELGLTLFDPSLLKLVSASDEEAVTARYLEMARYAGEFQGDSGALLASYGASEPEGLKPGTKIMLGLIGLVTIAFWLLDALS